MNSTVEGRVEYCAERGNTILSPLTSSEIAAVIHTGFNRDGDATYDVLMPNGKAFNVAGKKCSCGNVIDVEPTSEVTARRRKLGQACEHQNAQMESVNVGGTCSNCGELKVERTNHDDEYGNTLMRSHSCAGCGKSRSEQ